MCKIEKLKKINTIGLFLIMQFSILFSCFGMWKVSPDFLSIGHVVYHVYPVFIWIVALVFREKVDGYSVTIKFLSLCLPFSIWLIGVYLIWMNGNMLYL